MESEYNKHLPSIKTQHYTFHLNVKKTINGELITYSIIVGNKLNPCLEVLVSDFAPGQPINSRKIDWINTAHLAKVKSLEECVEDEITNEYFAEHSVGKELLDYIIGLLGRVSRVKHLTLNDESHIPCNRKDPFDQLDLLIYSIAMYGKTWYERNYNARPKHNMDYIQYKDCINKYISPEFKLKYDFDEFYQRIMVMHNPYVSTIINPQLTAVKTLYETTKTFPEFFNALKTYVPRKDKCRFFNTWLTAFISSVIKPLPRYWVIDIQPKRETRGGTYKLRQIRKRRKTQKSKYTKRP